MTLVTAVTGPSMPNSGWQVSFAAWLGHVSSVTGRALSWLPGWAVLAALSALAAALAWQARRARRRAGDPAAGAEVAGGPVPPVPGPPEPAESNGVTTASARAGQEAISHER